MAVVFFPTEIYGVQTIFCLSNFKDFERNVVWRHFRKTHFTPHFVVSFCRSAPTLAAAKTKCEFKSAGQTDSWTLVLHSKA